MRKYLYKQTDRQRDRHTETPAHQLKDRPNEGQRYRQTYRKIDRQTDRQNTDRQLKQTHLQPYKEKDTGKQKHIHRHTKKSRKGGRQQSVRLILIF